MNAVINPGLSLTAKDVTGQRRFSIKNFNPNLTVSELIRSLVPKMGLNPIDVSTGPSVYRAFLEREARHLHGAELVGESLHEADEITLQPDIQAGSGGL